MICPGSIPSIRRMRRRAVCAFSGASPRSVFFGSVRTRTLLAHYPSISVSVQAAVLWDMNGRQMPVSPLAISSSVPLGLMSMG